MNDAWTVYCKEMHELFGERHSLRGVLLQGGICILMTGIVVPIRSQPLLWSHITTILLLYAVYPATLAVNLAADAFAGERERRTLETLLSTPLSDYSIVVGKVASAITFALVVSSLSLLTGIAVSFLKGTPLEILPPWLVFGTLGCALGGAVLVSALGIAISARVPVARSAQQMGMFLTVGFATVSFTLFKRLGMLLGWMSVLRVDLVLLLLGVAGLFFAMRGFHRDRFFEDR